MRYNTEFLVFMAARIVGVGVRPLTLLLLIYLGEDASANDYALFLSAIASTFILLSNQNHRRLYERFISKESSRHSISGKDLFFSYIDGTIIHLVVFVPLVAFIAWFWVYDVRLLILILPIVITEKYFDDDQRVTIYKRRYYEWAINFFFRTVGPGIAFLLLVLMGRSWALEAYVVTAVLCFGLYALLFRRQFFLLLSNWAKRRFAATQDVLFKAVKRYWLDYQQEYFSAQLWVFLSSNILLIDRFFITRNFPDLFAEYVLIINIANIIPLVHGLLFFTQIRPRLLDRNLDPLAILLTPGNLLMPIILALSIPIGIEFAQYFGLFQSEIGLLTTVALTLIYVNLAITLVVAEFAFWRLARSVLVAIDACTGLITFAALFIVQLSLTTIPIVLFVTLSLRAGVVIYLCRRDKGWHRVDKQR